jgi:hypothetical protein
VRSGLHAAAPTAEHDDDGRMREPVRLHAQHAEKLLERAVLPDEVVPHARERAERRATDERRRLLRLRVLRLLDVVSASARQERSSCPGRSTYCVAGSSKACSPGTSPSPAEGSASAAGSAPNASSVRTMLSRRPSAALRAANASAGCACGPGVLGTVGVRGGGAGGASGEPARELARELAANACRCMGGADAGDAGTDSVGTGHVGC